MQGLTTDMAGYREAFAPIAGGRLGPTALYVERGGVTLHIL